MSETKRPATPGNPTDPVCEIRARVVRLARVGISPEEIAFFLGIGLPTLLALYGDVIKAAALQTKLEGREALWALVQSGRHPAATIFWARAHCGLAKPHEQQTKSSSSAKTTYYQGVPPPGSIRVLNHLGEVIG